jgi:hypothetical protein
MTVTEPGLVYGMDDQTYHADPIPGGSLSSTFARLLTEHVPAKADAIRRNRKPTKAMNLGKAAHLQALGAGPHLIVWEHDGRTKVGKAERAAAEADLASEAAVAVTPAERRQILDMTDVLLTDQTTRAIFDTGEAEVSAFWQDNGIWCRARYDILGPTSAHDYKTTLDATRRGFSKAMGKYGYHQQADFYLRGLAALGHKAAAAPFRFICQETTPPYLVQIHTPDDAAMSMAKELNDTAIDVYRRAQDTGIWPGFPTLEADPTPLHAWYWFEHEDETEMSL